MSRLLISVDISSTHNTGVHFECFKMKFIHFAALRAVRSQSVWNSSQEKFVLMIESVSSCLAMITLPRREITTERVETDRPRKGGDGSLRCINVCEVIFWSVIKSSIRWNALLLGPSPLFSTSCCTLIAPLINSTENMVSVFKSCDPCRHIDSPVSLRLIQTVIK